MTWARRMKVKPHHWPALATLLCLLSACSSSSDPNSTQHTDNHSDTADKTTFALSSFAHIYQNTVRRLPTDRAPTLHLAASDQQPFAPEGSGTFNARCQSYRFDYTYRKDPPSGPHRLTIDNVSAPFALEQGCDPGSGQFEEESAKYAVPVFSKQASLLSDQTESHLMVYGKDGEQVSFALNTGTPDSSTSALPLNTTDWTLAAYRLGANSLQPAPAGTPLSVRFLNDGTLTGVSPCYSLQGQYAEQNALISFSNVQLGSSSCNSQSVQASAFEVDTIRDALTQLMSGPVTTWREQDTLYLRQNEVSLVLKGRPLQANERVLDTQVLAVGGYPIPDSASGPGEQPLVQLIRQPEPLAQWWNAAVAAGNDLGPVPDVDFDRSVVMYLRLGLRPHLGESMTLRSATVNDDGIRIGVESRLSDNDSAILDGCAYDSALAHPFRFVMVSDDVPLPQAANVVQQDVSACSGL